MAQPQDPSAYIHLGLWFNHSKGCFRGLTLTVSPTSATLLTNLMALFVTMAGGQFWTIIRFSLHQIRALSPDKALDPAYNRQQVVLRNTTSATATAQYLIYLCWLSRKDTSYSSRRISSSIPIIILAVCSTVFFIAAGAFSNTVMDAGSDVLSRSPFCGFWNQTYIDIVWDEVPISPLVAERLAAEYHGWEDSGLLRSQQYAQDCYSTQGTGSSNCNMFKKSTLSMKTSYNGTCPFDPRVCLDGVDTVVFDSGLINTHEDLGINAVLEDRLNYRKVVQCTVLNDTAYTTGWMNQSSAHANQPTWRIANASYGHSLVTDDKESYSYSNFADFYTRYTIESELSYTVGSDQHYAVSGSQDSGSTFVPIPEIEQKDADVYLFYLSYMGGYLEPVDDPWFTAHQPRHIKVDNGTIVVTYYRDKPITTIGCTEQYQICSAPGRCTALLGFDLVQENINENLRLTSKQNVTLNQLLNSANYATLFQIVTTLAVSTAPLLAVEDVQNGPHPTSIQLPHDQWKLEIANWMSICMAHIQRLTVQSETGQIAAKPQYLVAPVTDSEKWICQNLMIRSDTYQSFSVLALSMLLVFGMLVIVLSLVIEPLSAWILRSMGRGDTGHEIWKAHDMLGPQLWRTRLEAILAKDTESQPRSKDSIACWDMFTCPVDEKGRKRISSQALSVEDRERLLIALAHELWK